MTHFPRIKLILPPLMPFAVIPLIYAITATGHQWRLHGDGVLVAIGFYFFLSGIAALIMETNAVPLAWCLLKQHAPLRTRWNYAAFGIGCAYLLAASIAVIWFIAELFIAP